MRGLELLPLVRHVLRGRVRRLQLRALLVLLGARGRQLLLDGGDRGRVFLLLVAQRLLVAQLGGLMGGIASDRRGAERVDRAGGKV